MAYEEHHHHDHHHHHIQQEMALHHHHHHLTDPNSILHHLKDPAPAKDIHRLIMEAAAASGKPQQLGGGPNWLSSAILRQQTYGGDSGSFLHLQTNNVNITSAAVAAGGGGSATDLRPPPQTTSSDAMGGGESSGNNDFPPERDQSGGGGGGGGGGGERDGGGGGGCGGGGGMGMGMMSWQSAKCKAEVLGHPLYEQLLSAHVACLRIATPVDQLPRIDAQLAQSQHVVAKYSVLGGTQGGGVDVGGDDKDLDQFMTHYVLLLCSFKEQLQQHVRLHAMEAVMACWELEQNLQSLTGVSPGEGTGATMSDDDDDLDGETNLYDGSLDGPDTMGFGPLIPTESERSLMERVRQELKHELKQGYKEKIVDIREEILRKRRAGKLPGDTTSHLKAWWQSHSKWPYPTEEDKARLVQETGLQLKQINNWFINQRKRNWHSNPSSTTALKSKRKSNAGEKKGESFV
ncbi:hypothetical protein Syun_025476 [Stephania yunnanensis]|uniref:Uncharacterized protein n=1 Tax=Stephania yunnanensis TaxID=152371 RepID=A0AAP0HVT9_9MAGN